MIETYRKKNMHKIYIFSELSSSQRPFSEHISSKINKANRNLGIMFRALTYKDKDMFLNLYKPIIRPLLEYTVTVYMPLYKKDMVAIENIQRRTTKLV